LFPLKSFFSNKASALHGDVVESLITLSDVLPPWTEYVPRCGWIDDTNAFVVVCNRLQNRAALVRIDTQTGKSTIWYEEISEGELFAFFFSFSQKKKKKQKKGCWINVQDNVLTPIHVFSDGSVLIASERSGYMHLYCLNPSGEIHPVTAGEFACQAAERYADSQFLIWVKRKKS
jgi:hypothetical protein